MADISRRTLVGAGGTIAAATLLTTTGTAQAAETESGERTTAPHTKRKETGAVMAATTSTLKYEAYVISDEGEVVASATFDGNADAGDMWAYVDSAKARSAQQYPNSVFTGHVQRYDQVVTDIPHP